MKHLLPLAIAPVALLIAACAPINPEKCASGNWYQIGLNDGINGHSDSRIAKLSQECAKHSLPTDEAQWRAGRIEGLKSYCTPRNAYAVGKNGRRLNNVCIPSLDLNRANSHGLHVYKLEERLDELKDQRREIRATLRNNFGSNLDSKLSPDMAKLRLQYLRLLRGIDRDIRDIERDLRRLGE